jgi:hypothetical protein
MRSPVWWGTWPLVLGLGGILLLAVGARAMPSDEELNRKALQAAEKVGEELRNVETPRERRIVLHQLAHELEQRRRPVPPWLTEPGDASDAELTARIRELLIEEFGEHRDPAAMIAGRCAFFAGLVLTAAAGVVLFRYAPDRDKPDWGVG